MAAGAQQLQELAVQKEQELQRLREQQQQALKDALKSCQEELGRQKARERELEQDFRYNLSLLQQRDEELSNYQLAFSELKKVVSAQTAETSDLKVLLDEGRRRLEQLEEEKQQLKQYYIHRLDQQEKQLDAYRTAKDEELSHHQREYERLQRQLQQRLLQVEEELAVQKQQLMNQFDDLSRRQEHEHRVKMDQLSAVVMSKESQVKLLQRQLVVAQNKAQQSQHDSSEVGMKMKQLEKKLREKEWDLTDTVNAKDTRISELESQLSFSQTTVNKLQSEFQLRCVELERAGKEKENILLAAKEAHRVRERELEGTIRDLHASLEQREVERRKLEWQMEDLVKEKHISIERCREEVVKAREKGEEQVTQLTQEKVATDLQNQSLQQWFESLQAELRRRNEEIERYKRDLRLATERERRMERNKVQLELDWQRRVEEREREVCDRQEELIRTSNRARDEAVARCSELEDKLSEQMKFCGVLQRQRTVAVRTLRDHGLTLQGREEEEEEEVTLRQQNQELRAVIHDMRREMERVSESAGQAHEDDNEERPTKGYVQYLESEVARLRSDHHHVTEQLRSLQTSAQKPPTPASGRGGSKHMSAPREEHMVCKNAAIVATLNKTLIALQKEKSTFELDMAQLRSRVRQLEGTVSSQQEEVYLKRAMSVPQSKVHHKLLQATHVIVQLVRERELLIEREKVLKNELDKILGSRQEEGGEVETTVNDKNGIDREHEQCSFAVAADECTCGSERRTQQPVVDKTITSNTRAAKKHSHPRHETQSRGGGSSGGADKHTQRTDQRIKPSLSLSPLPPSPSPLPVAYQTPADLSLSPLKFSDSSGMSTLLAAEGALKMVDSDSLLPSSPPHFTRHISTPVARRKEETKENAELLINGSKVTRAGQRRGRTRYVAPKLKKPLKPTIRNYNIKEE